MTLQAHMAKILTTAIVADIRNKLNGSVFSKNRYGGYVRTKVTPVNPQTAFQQAARNILATNSQAWRGLSEADRQSWISATPSFPFTDIFGNSKVLSGSALYAKLNGNLAQDGSAPLSAAPSPVSIPGLSGLSISAAAGTGVVSISLDQSVVPTDTVLIVDATPNLGPGISFVKNRFRRVTAAAATITTPVLITSEFAARFGAPVAGQKIFVRVFLISTVSGQSGIALQASTIVVP